MNNFRWKQKHSERKSWISRHCLLLTKIVHNTTQPSFRSLWPILHFMLIHHIQQSIQPLFHLLWLNMLSMPLFFLYSYDVNMSINYGLYIYMQKIIINFPLHNGFLRKCQDIIIWMDWIKNCFLLFQSNQGGCGLRGKKKGINILVTYFILNFINLFGRSTQEIICCYDTIEHRF